MGECYITRRGGISGAKLKVIAVADESSLPASSEEGTIAIIPSSDSTILGHGIGNITADISLPSSGSARDLGIILFSSSSVSIELSKAQSVKIYPISVYEYIVPLNAEGVWTIVDSYVYCNNEWVPMRSYLIKEGINNSLIGGELISRRVDTTATGGTITYNTGYIHYSGGQSFERALIKDTGVDLTGFRNVCAKAKKTASVKNGVRLQVYQSLADALTSVATASIDTTLTVYKLDISSLSGIYFLGISCSGYSTSTSQLDLYDWWLE